LTLLKEVAEKNKKLNLEQKPGYNSAILLPTYPSRTVTAICKAPLQWKLIKRTKQLPKTKHSIWNLRLN